MGVVDEFGAVSGTRPKLPLGLRTPGTALGDGLYDLPVQLGKRMVINDHKTIAAT
jgi:hypothetical protein